MTMDRRAFLAATAAATLPATLAPAQPTAARRPRRPVVISSGNGIPAVTQAMGRLEAGDDTAVAVVSGVTLVENDPEDMSVGYGGLPNADGVVQLDASVMHGPTHKAGAVAAIERIRNPARVALRVLRRTDHVLLVGDGARRFALAHGFREEDLLTEKSRKAWLKWKRNLNPNDDWLDDDQIIEIDSDVDGPEAMGAPAGVPWTNGTIHCAAVDVNGDLSAVTSTSGRSYKVPGRVGDTPIIGAGMYVDNAVGAAGATGRGEALIQSCGAFQIVCNMEDGDDPTEACLRLLRWIADHTRRATLLDARGKPDFDVTVYALRKDGAFGSATMRGRGVKFAVHDGRTARHEECVPLFG